MVGCEAPVVVVLGGTGSIEVGQTGSEIEHTCRVVAMVLPVAGRETEEALLGPVGVVVVGGPI